MKLTELPYSRIDLQYVSENEWELMSQVINEHAFVMGKTAKLRRRRQNTGRNNFNNRLLISLHTVFLNKNSFSEITRYENSTRNSEHQQYRLKRRAFIITLNTSEKLSRRRILK